MSDIETIRTLFLAIANGAQLNAVELSLGIEALDRLEQNKPLDIPDFLRNQDNLADERAAECEPTLKQMTAMYDAQCACTDEWVEKCENLQKALDRLEQERKELEADNRGLKANMDMIQVDAFIKQIEELKQQRDRLAVLATKWCLKTHHDWEELMELTKELDQA